MNERFRCGVGAALCVAAMGVIAAGCRAEPHQTAESLPFPALKQSRTLDIQVVRHGTGIEATNTTARAFGPSRLWLNRRFSRPIDGWKIGETLHLSLHDFQDEFGEHFRQGGFFAAEAPETIVQAQIEHPRLEADKDASGTELLGLIVVPGD